MGWNTVCSVNQLYEWLLAFRDRGRGFKLAFWGGKFFHKFLLLISLSNKPEGCLDSCTWKIIVPDWTIMIPSDVSFWSFDVGSSYHSEAEFWPGLTNERNVETCGIDSSMERKLDQPLLTAKHLTRILVCLFPKWGLDNATADRFAKTDHRALLSEIPAPYTSCPKWNINLLKTQKMVAVKIIKVFSFF